jgi:hypothetical protein
LLKVRLLRAYGGCGTCFVVRQAGERWNLFLLMFAGNRKGADSGFVLCALFGIGVERRTSVKLV